MLLISIMETWVQMVVSHFNSNIVVNCFLRGNGEDALMEAALDAGAEDVITNDDGSLEVITAPHDYVEVKMLLKLKVLMLN